MDFYDIQICAILGSEHILGFLAHGISFQIEVTKFSFLSLKNYKISSFSAKQHYK